MTMNTISPTSFTTSVLIADTLPNDQLSSMTMVGEDVVSAALEVQSTKGALLLSRLTTAQRDNGNFVPDNGMIIYNDTTDRFNVYQDGAWDTLSIGGGDGDVTGPDGAVANNITVFADNTGKVIADSEVALHIDLSSLFVTTAGYIVGGESNNTCFGVDNFRALTDGSGLTAMGFSALKNATAADSSSAFGYESQLTATTGSENCSFGTRTLALNIIGGQSCAFGTRSLQVSTASLNAAFGFESQLSATTATENCSFGPRTLALNLIGNQNSAFGTRSLQACTVSDNSAFGFESQLTATTGTGNCSFGARSLATNAVGSQSCAFGQNALELCIASANSAFGFDVLKNCVGGGSNTAVGANAGLAITTGTQNCIFGVSALNGSAAAGQNCAFGYSSLGGIVAGANNVAIGNLSANNEGATFVECTFLGSDTGSSNNNLQNATAIGAGTQIEINNAVNIGSDCIVGINKSTPAYTLDIGLVANTASIRLAQCNDAPVAAGGANGFVIYCAADGSLRALSAAGTDTPLAAA